MGIHTEVDIRDIIQLGKEDIEAVKMAAKTDLISKFNKLGLNNNIVDEIESGDGYNIVYEILCKVTLLPKNKAI